MVLLLFLCFQLFSLTYSYLHIFSHTIHYTHCFPSVLTLGSKQPASGLLKPRLNGIQSGIQRAASGLKPPSARTNAPASSSTDKLHGPAGTHAVVGLYALTVYSDIQSQI